MAHHAAGDSGRPGICARPCLSEETDNRDKISTVEYSLNEDGLLEMRDQQGNLTTHPVEERDEPIYRHGKEATIPWPSC
ncbi:hypothetical protein N7540_002120 [Penicillium herquei]|nr:hypothetical protein N7540_002120 [Penicillium herquei]